MLLRMQEQELDTSREANDKTCTETALSQPSLKLSLLSDHENLIESAIDRIVHETQSVYLHNVSHSRSSPLLLQLDELSTSLLTDTHRPPYIVDDDGKSVVSAAYSSVSDDDDSSRFSLLRLLSESGRLDRFLESPLMPLLQNQMLNEAWRTNRHEVVLLNIANLVARGHLISARYLLMLLQRLVHNLCVCVCVVLLNVFAVLSGNPCGRSSRKQLCRCYTNTLRMRNFPLVRMSDMASWVSFVWKLSRKPCNILNENMDVNAVTLHRIYDDETTLNVVPFRFFIKQNNIAATHTHDDCL